MYEDIVARAAHTTEAAVRESQERVDLAVQRSQEAEKKAKEASKAVGERWTNRINAMRRRVADRDKATSSTEMRFGPEDGTHPGDSADGDELISLTEPTAPSAAPGGPPPFGMPEELVQQQPPAAVHRPPSQEPARFVADIGTHYEEEPAAPTFSPPTRRAAAPRRRPRDDEDDDYSGQSWLEGR